MYLYRRVEEVSLNHSDARQAIGTFVLKHHTHLSDYTIADIAEQTYTSKASVTRFAKALGFPGWREFIKAFMVEELQARQFNAYVDPNFPFTAEDSLSDVMQKLGDLAAETLGDTYRHLDRGMLSMGVRFIVKAHDVYVFAHSPNSYLGGLFCRKLMTIGKRAHLVVKAEAGLVANVLGQTDCAIIISYSGNNKNVFPMQHVPTLINNQVPTIAITGEGTNYLRRTCACVLTVSSHERMYNKIANFATEESIGFILNSLFSCYFAQDYERNLAYKVSLAERLEEERLVGLPAD